MHFHPLPPWIFPSHPAAVVVLLGVQTKPDGEQHMSEGPAAWGLSIASIRAAAEDFSCQKVTTEPLPRAAQLSLNLEVTLCHGDQS